MECLVTLIVSRPVNRFSDQTRLLNRRGQKNRSMKGHRPGSAKFPIAKLGEILTAAYV
ncbi:hypothetical protein MTR_5g096690 [Medicago truncatula]|uniref:Uncharacterized protein n=1 Tax=Medicago truncatula TaxID=3880 RepID=G7K4T6_MEDTR|nr:hypothetical protein MTR_5g096690 [Medicago truncatula]